MLLAGILVYLGGFLLLFYLIEETDVIGDGFGGVMIIFLIITVTIVLGKILIGLSEVRKNTDKDERAEKMN